MGGLDLSQLKLGGTRTLLVQYLLRSPPELNMTQRSSTTSWARRSLPIALVVIALAVGCCLFQVTTTGAHHDGMSVDLCAGFFLVSFFVTLLYLAEVSTLPVEPLSAIRAVCLHLLDPPPKQGSLA
jgi:hypothetical protein